MGPGEKTDFINIQRLLPQRGNQTQRPSHIIYIHYNNLEAELWCNYDEARNQIGDYHIKRINSQLQYWLASPTQLEYALYERLSSGETRDHERIHMFLQQGPLEVRMRPERDDNGNRFIEVNLLCRNTNNYPWTLRLAGKLWNVNMTEEEELLTNNERQKLRINDVDWLLWGGQDQDADDAGANQN